MICIDDLPCLCLALLLIVCLNVHAIDCAMDHLIGSAIELLLKHAKACKGFDEVLMKLAKAMLRSATALLKHC